MADARERSEYHAGLALESMVDVAQLVELRVVIPAVEGSSPFVHPIPIVRPAAGGRSLTLSRAQSVNQEPATHTIDEPVT